MTEPNGGTPAPAPAQQETGDGAPAQRESAYMQRLRSQIDKMIDARGGGFDAARSAAVKLLEDNQEQRDKMRRMRSQVVGQGAEVLRGTELEAWKAFRALNLTPAQLKEKLDLLPTLQNKVKEYDNERFFEQVSDHMGFTPDGRKMFTKLAKLYGLEFEVRDVEVPKDDGTKDIVKKPFAKIAGDAASEFKALDVYLDTDLKEFKPHLYAETDDSLGPSDRVTPPTPTHAPERKVTPMPTQTLRQSAPPEPPVRRAVNSTLDTLYPDRVKKAAADKT
jgi:hypothetical protein